MIDNFNVNVVKTTEDVIVVEVSCVPVAVMGERRRFSITELAGVIKRSVGSSVELGEFISGNPINNYNPSQSRAQFVFKKRHNERMLLTENSKKKELSLTDFEEEKPPKEKKAPKKPKVELPEPAPVQEPEQIEG